MEVKLSHRRFSDLSLPRFHFPNPKTTFPSQRFLLFSSDPLMHFHCFLSLFAKDLILFFSFFVVVVVVVCVCFNCSLKWWVNSKKHFTVLAEVQSFFPCYFALFGCQEICTKEREVMTYFFWLC
jgi:hypothetical protein